MYLVVIQAHQTQEYTLAVVAVVVALKVMEELAVVEMVEQELMIVVRQEELILVVAVVELLNQDQVLKQVQQVAQES
jgi:hypothetical protein